MANIFNKPINEIIRDRHSVRSYENIELAAEVKEKLQVYLDEINHSQGIFGGKVRAELVQKHLGEEIVKLGTYGVIKGSNYYLTVAYEKNSYDLEDLGFLFEKGNNYYSYSEEKMI